MYPLKKAGRVVVAASVAVSALLLAPAGATAEDVAEPVVPPGEVVIATVGADATYQAMLGILPNDARHFNVPSLPSAPYPVEGDANCPDLEYVAATPGPGQAIAPVSNGNGLNALKAQATAPVGQRGCIDIARASGPPRGLANDPATFEYYAFALDAVSWASPSLQAPATLTLAQLQGIYNCTITSWDEIPGAGSGPIQRYFTQEGSGTGSFFQSDLLAGQNPLTVSSPDCPPVKRILQSQALNLDPIDREAAILPYSVGAWIFQANNRVNPTIDVRNGVKLGGITVGETRGNAAAWNHLDEVYQADTEGVVNENNVKLNDPTPDYPGIRYFYNTLDSVSPNYAEAAELVAFDNIVGGFKSPLCSGERLSPILSVGLGELSSDGNPGGNSNLAGSTCRLFTN